MNNLYIKNSGFFEGEFLVCTEDATHSLGNYIEVVRTGPLYPTGKVVEMLDRPSKPIFALPMIVTLSAWREKINVVRYLIPGLTAQHWDGCLEIGKPSVIIPCRYENRGYCWYSPKINGWVPGLNGKAKAPSITNKR